MIKKEYILLILLIRIGFVDAIEGCMNEEEFNRKYQNNINANLKEWLGKEKLELRNLREFDHTWKSKWNSIENHDEKFVVVKKANLKENLNQFKRLEREIEFYRNWSKNPILEPHLPNYYGCVTYKDDTYLIIQFFSYSIQKYKPFSSSYTRLLGYKSFQAINEKRQIKFLIDTAKVVNELHLNGIALTNINPKNILLKPVGETVIPVFINFGLSQSFQNVQIPTDQSREELTRYDEYLIYCIEKQPGEYFSITIDNLKRADILGFANLFYRLWRESAPQCYKDFTIKFRRYLDNFRNEELLSERKFIQNN
jgi:serine/threonine protein kinase